ncbi:MAG: hypothetical protein V4613_00680 [Bacteroidota bacterium]
MKIKIYALITCLVATSIQTIAQNIKAVAGETTSKVQSRPFISRIYNNKIYIANKAKNTVEVTVFDAESMSKLSEFKFPIKDKEIKGEEVFFMDGKILIRYFLYPSLATEYFDIYDFSGKQLHQRKELVKHKFKNENGEIEGAEIKISEDGKFLLLASNGGNKKGKDYNLFDSDLKLVFNKTIKYEGVNYNGVMMYTVLTNTGEIGQLIRDDGGLREVRFVTLDKTAGKFIEGETILSEMMPSLPKAYFKEGMIYLGGTLQIPGEADNYKGAYSIKINLTDLSVAYSHEGLFTTEQIEDYTNKHNQIYNGSFMQKPKEPRIFNCQVSAITVDKNDNVVFSLSSTFQYLLENIPQMRGVNMTQFICADGAISNFNVMYLFQHDYSFLNEMRFGNIIFSNGIHIRHLYNDDKDYIGINFEKKGCKIAKNKTGGLSAENIGENSNRSLLFPPDQNIHIFPKIYIISSNICYMAGVLDGDKLVLVKLVME